ncbi:hypothetical protein ColTof4_09174 [Colletotrichum tofieldiae]|nr:hypothetical protein ColTof3_03618 [Colletotrichum tofieldiae]GKT76751.1 hypothetical protein ColTof4_09174 [Colletotrichum tofieldiae]GKT97404.1 hypothetical protein Ct61P_15254 [Colletotrichum tofieldiae]
MGSMAFVLADGTVVHRAASGPLLAGKDPRCPTQGVPRMTNGVLEMAERQALWMEGSGLRRVFARAIPGAV